MLSRPALRLGIALSLVAARGSAAQQRKPMTLDDLMQLATIVDARIAPAGDQVAYVVSTPSVERNQHEPALFVVAASGGVPMRLADSTRILNTPLPSPQLRWSPDGSRIGFLGLGPKGPQVFAVDAASGSVATLTDAPQGAFAFEWSPDGKSVAYLTSDAPAPSVVIHAGAPDPATRVALQPLDGSPARTLTPPDQYVEGFTWSPDGREIAYAASPISGFSAQYATRIYAVPAEGGTPRTVVDGPGMHSTPRYSPDGSRVAFISSGGKVSIMAPRGLAVAPARGGTASDVRAFPLDDAWVGDVTWAADGKSILMLTQDGTFGRREHMFEQPVVRVWLDTGRAEVIAGGPYAHYSLTQDRAGSKLVYRRVASKTMGDLVVRDVATGRETTVTDANPQLHDFALGELRPIQWRSFDGMEVWGLLLTPPGYAAGRRVPLLVYIHGGPGGGVTYGLFPQFMQTVGQVDYYPSEALAGAGYAILFPMPRGGAGYGEAGQRAIIDDWGNADLKDIMTGVDHVIAMGIADPDRLGVMGASYGGFMTSWIVTQTSRFQAASSGASITSLVDEYYLSDSGEVLAQYFKLPWEAPESYAAHSPVTFADRVNTPLLLQHGERDQRVPVANAWTFYRALKDRGKTVELDIHPGSAHLFFQPVQENAAMGRNLEWFQRWIPVP